MVKYLTINESEAEYLMKNYGDRGGGYPLFYYSFKIVPTLKTKLKHAYLHRC